MKILFITQGGNKIGLGHIRRSLAVARQAKKEKLGHVSFFITGDEIATMLVSKAGFRIGAIKRPDVAVFDTKEDITLEIASLKSSNTKIILIDNTTPARLLCDVVIYPISHYSRDLNWSRFKGKKYIGTKFFPLNQAFKRSSSSNSKVIRCLVTMGGSDPNNQTSKVASALRGLDISMKTTLALGPAFDGELPKLDERFKVVQSKDNAVLMKNVDIAFTAFGTSLYELAFMGIPAIIIYNYPEDKEDVNNFIKCGTAISLGYHTMVTASGIKNSFLELIHNRKRLQTMSTRGKKLVDGNGASRICAIIKNL